MITEIGTLAANIEIWHLFGSSQIVLLFLIIFVPVILQTPIFLSTHDRKVKDIKYVNSIHMITIIQVTLLLNIIRFVNMTLFSCTTIQVIILLTLITFASFDIACCIRSFPHELGSTPGFTSEFLHEFEKITLLSASIFIFVILE